MPSSMFLSRCYWPKNVATKRAFVNHDDYKDKIKASEQFAEKVWNVEVRS